MIHLDRDVLGCSRFSETRNADTIISFYVNLHIIRHPKFIDDFHYWNAINEDRVILHPLARSHFSTEQAPRCHIVAYPEFQLGLTLRDASIDDLKLSALDIIAKVAFSRLTHR